MKIKRIIAGTYEAHTDHGVYAIERIPGQMGYRTQWFVTLPDERRPDLSFDTLREAVVAVSTNERSEQHADTH